MSRTQQENAGPLSSIQDTATRKEIGKLWSSVNSMRGQTGTEAYATQAQLTALERKLLSREKETLPPAGPTVISSGSSGGGLDLRPLNNTWTGQNIYSRIARVDDPAVRIESLNSGTSMVPPGATRTIMLDNSYSPLVDIRRTTNAGEASTLGGNAAVYVQHRISADTSLLPNVNSGIRVQVESWQRSPPSVLNDCIAGLFGIYNHGFNSGGYGVHVEAYHAATFQGGVADTTGVSVQLFREFLAGHTIGFHVRPSAAAPFSNANDWGFLVSPDGGGGKFNVAYGAGSQPTGILNCDYGLDLSYATCNRAAIMVPMGKRIMLNAPNEQVSFRFDPVGKIRFTSNLGDHFWIGNDGSIGLSGPLWLDSKLNDDSTIGTGLVYDSADDSVQVVFKPRPNVVKFTNDGSVHATQLWLNSHANVNGTVAVGADLFLQNADVRSGPDLTSGAVVSPGSDGFRHQAFVKIKVGIGSAASYIWLPYFQ